MERLRSNHFDGNSELFASEDVRLSPCLHADGNHSRAARSCDSHSPLDVLARLLLSISSAGAFHPCCLIDSTALIKSRPGHSQPVILKMQARTSQHIVKMNTFDCLLKDVLAGWQRLGLFATPPLGSIHDKVQRLERDQASFSADKFQAAEVPTNARFLDVPRCVDRLADILSAYGVDPSMYGQAKARTLDHLLKELGLGECYLQPVPMPDGRSQLVRVLNIVSIKVKFGEMSLVEKFMTVEDGRTRPRGNLLSEKMFRLEDKEVAVRRGLDEELGLKEGSYTIIPTSWSRRVEYSNSSSYPGMTSEYHINAVEVHLNDMGELPWLGIQQGKIRNRAFDTHEAKDFGRSITHQWLWVDQGRLSEIVKCRGQGDLTEAAELQREILEVRIRDAGPGHPGTLISKANLAHTLQALGDLRHAEELQREVLEARLGTLGPEDPHTLASKCNLGNTLLALMDLEGAKALHFAVLKTKIRTLGHDHPDTLRSKAFFRMQHGDGAYRMV